MKIIRLAASLFFIILISRELPAQIPVGGIRLNSATGTTFQQVGKCTASAISVADQAFTEGIRISVQSDISNTWDAQVKFPAIEGIETGDIILVSFFARTISSTQETGEGNVTVVIENNTSYTKDISYTLTIGNEWRQYYASAESGHTLSSSQISYLFHCGFPDQIIEVADVQYLNYKQTLSLDDLPVTEITYYGQDPDAEWRPLAAERINQIRKGIVDLTIYDEAGQLVEGASISIEMVQHQFGFGTAIAASEFNSNATYRNKVLEMFNEVVFENDLKWPQFNPNSTDHITRAMDTLDAHNIPIRGHNIIWPSWRFTPDFLETLKDDPIALRNAIDMRFDQVTQFTKGRLVDWDVMNEPYSEHDIQNILGNEIMAEWFNRARQNDRSVKLYVNDYSIISAGGKNTEKQNYYYNLIKQIEADGGHIDGIGLQGHMSSELTPITKVYDIVEKYAELGKEIKITEHDINLPEQQQSVQADYTRDFMTILFSHASVKSLLVWGFWAGRHWRPEAAFFNDDWSIRPHGVVWNDLIYNQWWTPKTDLVTDSDGHTSLDGFLGKYKYSVSYGEQIRSGYFFINNSKQSGLENKVIISLDSAIPEKVKITSSVDGYLCSGEIAVLKAPEGKDLTYKWYKDDVLSDNDTNQMEVSVAGIYKVTVEKAGVSQTSDPYEVLVRPSPVSEISPTGDITICDNEGITITARQEENLEYFWDKNGQQIMTNTTEFEVETSGTYSLRTAANGCVSNSEQLRVKIGETPVAEIKVTGDNPVCEGQSTYLLGTTGTNINYKWYKDSVELGISSRVIEVFESGSYVVETSIGDCSALSDPFNFIVNPIPEAEITVEGELTFCEGNSVELLGNYVEGLIYTWKNDSKILDETDKSITVYESGSYTLTTTLENCSASSDPVIVIVLSPTDPDCANSIIEDLKSVRVYPNPFRGSFKVETSNEDNVSKVEVLNILGERVFTKNLESASNILQIYVEKPGLYLLRIYKADAIETISVIGK